MNMVEKYVRQRSALWKCYRQVVKHKLVFSLCSFIVIVYGVRKYLTGSLDLNTRNDIDYIAEHVHVSVRVVDNLEGAVDTGHVPMAIGLNNTGPERVNYGHWRIYFYDIRNVREDILKCNFKVKHVNGGLFYLSPIEGAFRGLESGESIVCLTLHYTSVARSDILPNWYVAPAVDNDTSIKPRIISNTMDETLSFVAPQDTPKQWKRGVLDNYNPYSVEERFQMNEQSSANLDQNNIIPTPLSVQNQPGPDIRLDTSWTIDHSDHFPEVVSFLAKHLKLGIKPEKDKTRRKIKIKYLERTLEREEYKLEVNTKMEVVIIYATYSPGAFYGTQSLLSLLTKDITLSPVLIHDKPRYSYRGLMIDVARNFHPKETIMEIIDAMAMYKLNKLHIHLTDDEGWRIEIPSIPELTKVGSKRCHSFENGECLMPSLGSGPNSNTSGSGFYTISDYTAILNHAAKNHVQVIPEIDMPGHAMAAVLSMNFRESHLKEMKKIDPSYASYVLTDDVSSAESVQSWKGNSINPCLDSAYDFVDTVFNALKDLHKGIQPLEIIHIGGDEVAGGAWDNSPACQLLLNNENINGADMKKMFMHKAAELAASHGINVAAWEDGMYYPARGPYKRDEFKNKDVYVMPWNNMWQSGLGGRAIEFADSGYKVILAMATHLYFDHPYEPDPEERGLYWATRYTDTFRVFGFMPENIFANADFDGSGNAINAADLCTNGICPKTKFPENVAGIEACTWSETIRTAGQLHNMIFPRLLALAERSWHKASWEDLIVKTDRDHKKKEDWESFTNSLGHKELVRLEQAGIHYRVPIPGVKVDAKQRILKVNTLYPNHDVYMTADNGVNWKLIGHYVKLPNAYVNISIKAMSKVLRRSSRTVSLHVPLLRNAVFVLTPDILLILNVHILIALLYK